MNLLFVGNSHTSRNGLAYQVRELVNAAPGPGTCRAFMSTFDGKGLGFHATEPGTQLNIACNRWDFISLQQATHPFAGYEQLSADCAALVPFLSRSGAEILLLETWKRKDAPDSDQRELNEAFSRVAREQGARVVPAGSAWLRASREFPNIELYHADGGHASPAGTYLTACVFLVALTGRSPLGLPAKVAIDDLVLADLPANHAESLQRVAEQQYKDFIA